jgi:hypothetical protein
MKENNEFHPVERISVKNMQHNSNHYNSEIEITRISRFPFKIRIRNWWSRIRMSEFIIQNSENNQKLVAVGIEPTPSRTSALN